MRRVGRHLGLAAAAVVTLYAADLKAPGAPPVSPLYRIRLGPFVAPPNRTVGLLVRARINAGPLLRLLLDSGTQCVVLDRKAAAKSGFHGGTDLDLVGAGATQATKVKTQNADSIEVGDLVLRDVPILLANRRLAEGVDGALPLSIFSQFLIRLDVPGKSLDLLPYPESRADSSGDVRSVANHDLMFVKGTVNESREGFFLLDTGASYSAISQTLARQLGISETLADRVPLRGGTAELDAPLFRGAVRLRLGSRELATDPVVAVDLSTTSRYHRLEVAGLIGYPALRDSVLTVSYRDSFIRIDPR